MHYVTDPLNLKEKINDYHYHIITSKRSMHKEAVAAFVGETDAMLNTTVKLSSVAMVVHVA